MKIMVTGANGQVGYCLQEQLAKTNFDFLALTREDLDITNLIAVEKVVCTFKPNIIINAAAYTAVDKAESDAKNAYAVNRDGAANLATAARNANAAIFHVSTDYVFSGNSIDPYNETAPTEPQGIYGKSKLDGETAVAMLNPKHIIIRTAWVFGEHGNNFVKTMLRLGKTSDSLSIVADQKGGPTYANDIAKALITIAKRYQEKPNLPWGIYHYSGMPYTNWYNFAVNIFQQAESASVYSKSIPTLRPICTAEYPTPAKRPANSCLDCNKIYQTFGISQSDWQLALKKIKAYAG